MAPNDMRIARMYRDARHPSGDPERPVQVVGVAA